MDDAAATRACRAGETDAFRHFVARYQRRALAHARLLTRNEADAAEATQEAFVDAFRSLATFDSARAFYPWFYVVLRNRCLKQRTRRATRAESGVLPDLSRHDPAVSEGHLDVWRAIRRLDPDEAELVVLKHIEGWTYEELSAALAVPRGTVMSRLYAARREWLNGLELLARELREVAYPRDEVDLWAAVHQSIRRSDRAFRPQQLWAIAGMLLAWRALQLFVDLPVPVLHALVPLAASAVLLWRAGGDLLRIETLAPELQKRGL